MRNDRFGCGEASSVMWTVPRPGLRARGRGGAGVLGGEGQACPARHRRRKGPSTARNAGRTT